MTPRRTGKPTPRFQPEATRSYAAETVFGTRENPNCDRHARETCAVCAGEHCLSHNRHPGHDESDRLR
jgi:hypothetical protein